jgi:hypothetical protein
MANDLNDALRYILQRDLEQYLELERITAPMKDRLLDAALSGSIEPGRWTVNIDARSNQPIVVENFSDPTIAAHAMLDSFRAVRKAVTDGTFEKDGDLSPELRRKLDLILSNTIQYHCRRMKLAAHAAWLARYRVALVQAQWEDAGSLIFARLRLLEMNATFILLRFALNRGADKMTRLCLLRLESESVSLIRT